MDRAERVSRHETVSAAISAMTDAEITDLLGERAGQRIGIGGSTRSIEVGAVPVFVKMIKVTDRELAAGPADTANLFGLPPWYQYGVGEGSTGYSAWRELAMHSTVSGWVRDGEHDSFPLLHHWRLLPAAHPDPTVAQDDDLQRAVRFWGDSAPVAQRLQALARADTVAVTFIEHVPHVLRAWLAEQLAVGGEQAVRAVQLVERDLLDAAARLRSAGIVHFDAHLDNVLTTGEQILMPDFGLASSAGFDLDEAERVFLDQHVDHDVPYCAAQVVNAIVRAHLTFPGPAERNAWVHRCAETATAPGIPDALAPTVTRLAPVTTAMNDFYWQLHAGRVTTPFPAARLADAARDAGLPF